MEKEFEEFRLNSESIAQELAKTLNVPYFNLQFIKPEIDALKYLPKNLAEKAKVLPIKKERNILTLGVIDPYSQELEKIKQSLAQQGIEVKIGIISPKSLEIGLEEYKFLKEKKVTYIGTFEVNQKVFAEVKEKVQKRQEIENLLKDLVKSDPFLILDYLLAGAVKFFASDIHFEPYENEF